MCGLGRGVYRELPIPQDLLLCVLVFVLYWLCFKVLCADVIMPFWIYITWISNLGAWWIFLCWRQGSMTTKDVSPGRFFDIKLSYHLQIIRPFCYGKHVPHLIRTTCAPFSKICASAVTDFKQYVNIKYHILHNSYSSYNKQHSHVNQTTQ